MTPRRHFLITMFALLAVAGAVAVVQGWSATRRAPVPPHRSAAPPPALGTPAPTAREILDGADRLALTTDQRRRLEELASRWAAESAPLEAQMKAAVEEFTRFMDEAARTGGATLAEIQRRSAEASAQSETFRERWRQHGAAAAEVLGERQRTVLQTTSPVRAGGSR